MENLLQLLTKATAAETGYLYWVNRKREQFVLETTQTELSNVMFKDRIDFEKFFLDDYKNIKTPVQLEIGKQLDLSQLTHYFNRPSVKYLTIIPFQNNGETVSLTVLESENALSLSEFEKSFSSYISAHVNVLNTYLELTDLHEDEQKWLDYDQKLNNLATHTGNVDILDKLIKEVQGLLPTGGVVLAVRGMSTWVTALRSVQSPKSPEVGLMVEEKSLAYEALNKGESLFSIHFNQNPKRISSSEVQTEGATLAIPMLIRDKRQAVLLAYDKNPLVFKESVKHQMKNLVRVAALEMKSEMSGKEIHSDLFTTEYGNFIQEIWMLSLDQYLKRKRPPTDQVWFGMIGINNLAELRSQYRLEDLKKVQRLMVKALNPSRLGYNGLIGFNSDYVFTYMFSGSAEEDHQQWLEANMKDLKSKLDLGDARHVEVDIKAGFVKITSDTLKSDKVLSDAKQALNIAMTNKDATYVSI
jgi:hypothetical protein